MSIPGTKPIISSSQLLISTGIPTLDSLIGGGVPVGATILINEDTHGIYSKVMLKYFIAEAIVSEQSSLTVSLDSDPTSDFIHSLPALNEEPELKKQTETINQDVMKIAFRYQNLPTNEKEVKHKFGHYYDLSTNMNVINLDTTKHSCLSLEDIESTDCERQLFTGHIFNVIANKLLAIKDDPRYSDDDNIDKKSILRLIIHRLGSAMWDNLDELPKFLYFIRCIMRQCFGVAYISIPSFVSPKLKEVYENRLLNISDIAMSLISFAGTHYEKNKFLSDFHGFFNVDKLAAINSFWSPHPGPTEYTFKLLRKKFSIEKLHLPPDVDIGTGSDDKKSNKKKSIMSSCGGPRSNLDF